MTKSRWILSLGILLVLASLAPADDTQLPVLKTKTRTVAVFKNGLAFVVQEGSVHLADGWAVSDSIPQASLGSLWIAALDPGARLAEVVSLKESRSRMRPALTLSDLFLANLGKKVSFRVENTLIEGRIKNVLGSRPGPGEIPAVIDGRRAALPPAAEGNAIIIETSKGDVAVNKNLVQSLQFLDPPETSVRDTESVKRLRFKVIPARAQARVGLFYLQKGTSWTPAYLVDLVNDHQVRMTMQALVVNDAEDFEAADLQFVVGYPNFLFADVPSPLTQDQSLAQFLTALDSGGRRRIAPDSLSNIAVQRMAELDEEEGAGLTDYLSSAAGRVEGASTEDLFFYRLPGVTLKKGERALYSIFSESLDYRPIYEWTIPDTTDVDAAGDQRRAGIDRSRDQVWHSLKLKNSTSVPWTTAPALAVRDGKPLAQEMLIYTSKGASVNLKLTVAADILTSRRELEAGRQRDVTVYRHSYDLVTVLGELKVKNNKDKAVTLDIRKSLTGEVLEAGGGGLVEKAAEGLKSRAVNPNSRITWEIPLEPGRELTLSYKYKIYVSH